MTISLKKAITGDRETTIREYEPIDEFQGKLALNPKKGLMRSVIENDREVIEQGKLITDSINQGISSFTASTIFEQLVRNYSLAESIYGETIIRRITGFEPGLVHKNIKLPEFQRELLKNIEERIEGLKEQKLIDNEGTITERAVELSSLILYTEELEKIMPKDAAGEKLHKKPSPYGMKDELKAYRKDRYSDLSIRKSLKKAILRGHNEIRIEDLMSYKRKGRGQKYIIYGIDASGSMKGEKLEKSKKAGIALAYKAISEKDNTGLIVFGTGVKASIHPTLDFAELLREITKIRASTQTNIADSIRESASLFPEKKATKHLILITDALPTKGESPDQDTIEAAATAAARGITISVIGITLDRKGAELAKKIAEVGKGRLYAIKDAAELDAVVLTDYYET
ncbi:VWA domain-containing protein [Candidatus Woesearchaeota archaeon]|nr:VWA domain-containing protein [Candidatus Woesearchaeota archaeon]